MSYLGEFKLGDLFAFYKGDMKMKEQVINHIHHPTMLPAERYTHSTQ